MENFNKLRKSIKKEIQGTLKNPVMLTVGRESGGDNHKNGSVDIWNYLNVLANWSANSRHVVSQCP